MTYSMRFPVLRSSPLLNNHLVRSWFSSSSVRSVWVKSVPEQPTPLEGEVIGTLPDWLSGRLVRNGPGLFEIGDTKLKHWFDGMALLHSFTIQSGKVLYTSKFLRSDSYINNMAANRLVTTEFGTYAVPDPCQTLFQKVRSYFTSLADPNAGVSDNCIVSVYPAGDKYIAATETDTVHMFSPETLDTKGKVRLSQRVAVNLATAHPHIESDGTVYNLGTSPGGYNIIKIPPTGEGEDVLAKASVLCTVPPTNRLKLGYNHSFGATENYFICLEQPLRLDIAKAMSRKILNKQSSFADLVAWDNNTMVKIFVIEKATGKVLSQKFVTLPEVIILHFINAYEDNGHIVLDGCSHTNMDLYSELIVENINKPEENTLSSNNVTEIRRYVLPIDKAMQAPGKEVDLVGLSYSNARAYLQDDGSILCHHETISEKPFELPRINYGRYNGKPYQYVYGVDLRFKEIIKADLHTQKCLTWSEDGVTVSEGVFVEKPGATREDEGVVLTAALPLDESKAPFLLVLNAETLSEIARAQFPGIQWHKDIHGMFINDA